MKVFVKLLGRSSLFLTFAGIALLVGCSSGGFGLGPKENIIGESVVLIRTEGAKLAYSPRDNGSLSVRSTYQNNLSNTVQYVEGRDYVVDYKTAQIRRTPQSRIPDFSTNMLFGVNDFDHSKFPGFGNGGFFAFIDYTMTGKKDWPKQSSQAALLPITQEKLNRGDNLKIVAFGDSITAGGDATDPKLIFWQQWSDHLQGKYPKAKIQIVNGATGGDTTRNGIDRLGEKVLSQKPDLVLIGFGMNDHNIGGFGTPLDAFTNNLATMIDRIRKDTGAEVLLFSTFPPNPKWHYGSHNMPAYARATEEVARMKNCAFADIYGNWIALESRKKPEDLLGNNINHPNDFGHWMYFAVLEKVGL